MNSPQERNSSDISRVGVLGLWHLGCVTAACLAERGFNVVGFDPDSENVSKLRLGEPPVAEPGLEELIRGGLHSGKLNFDEPVANSLENIDVLWVTFDTPVDDEDRADAEWVIDRARISIQHISQGALVIISSQLPVGSAARLASFAESDGRGDLRFSCIPENLRLGNALASFRTPERIVAGVRANRDRERLSTLLAPFTDHIEWMGVESAEMTKHALNGFLAVSVTFINEIATLCECVGADASEVSRGLKSDIRIGPRSYLSPGDSFAGGTLARDVSTLNQLANDHDVPAYLMSGIENSNRAHRGWARRIISEYVGGGVRNSNVVDLTGKCIAIWGLTYKPGTNTLRRSASIELCHWLVEQGATVRAHDPAITSLADSEKQIELHSTPIDAAQNADALIVCTPWPEYKDIDVDNLVEIMRDSIVLDAGGHIESTVRSNPLVRYFRVGERSQ